MLVVKILRVYCICVSLFTYMLSFVPQQDEVSDDLLTFHEAVNHMQDMEEEIIDDQKALIDVSRC